MSQSEDPIKKLAITSYYKGKLHALDIAIASQKNVLDTLQGLKKTILCEYMTYDEEDFLNLKKEDFMLKYDITSEEYDILAKKFQEV